MRRALTLGLLWIAVALGTGGPLAAWEIRRDAPPEDFEAFHRRFSSAVYFYPRHGAQPLGWTGFEIWGDVSADPGFGGQDFAETVIDGDLPLDALGFARVGVRKGLPGGLDLGLAYGRAVGADLELVSGEIGWALIRGGALKPALGFRFTGTRTLGASDYELDQVGLELVASKGFTVVTVFGGAGVARSESTLVRPLDGRLSEETTDEVLFAGVSFKLLLPRLTFSVEQGDEIQGAVRIGFGF